MIWHDEEQQYELSTGKRFYANCGILGVGPEADGVSEGFDGGVGDKENFTADERHEMAAEMIRRWQAWAE